MISSNTNSDHGRSAHPFAQGLWAQLRDRSGVERRYIHDLLLADLGLATLSGKQEVAAEALSRFIGARALEMERGTKENSDGPASWAFGTPSRRNYDVFRADQPSTREWPSSSYIRNAFGNDWQAALAAIGHEPAVDVTSRRLTASPKPYSRDEILAALRIWVAEVDQEHGPETFLMLTRYEKWALGKCSLDHPHVTRLPRRTTIYKFFDDWREVLVFLGCAHRHYSRAQWPAATAKDGCPMVPEEPAAGLDLDSAPPDPPRKGKHPGSDPDYARTHADASIAWLRWLAEQLPKDQRASLRMEDFERYMSSVRRLSLARGKPLNPPSHAAFQRSPVIHGWPHAKHLAGVIKGRVPDKRMTTRPFTERELIDALIAALIDLGPNMSRAEYGRWRDKQDRRLPSASKLRRHFSDTASWSTAIETALRRASELDRRPADPGAITTAMEPDLREAA